MINKSLAQEKLELETEILNLKKVSTELDELSESDEEVVAELSESDEEIETELSESESDIQIIDTESDNENYSNSEIDVPSKPELIVDIRESLMCFTENIINYLHQHDNKQITQKLIDNIVNYYNLQKSDLELDIQNCISLLKHTVDLPKSLYNKIDGDMDRMLVLVENFINNYN